MKTGIYWGEEQIPSLSFTKTSEVKMISHFKTQMQSDFYFDTFNILGLYVRESALFFPPSLSSLQFH